MSSCPCSLADMRAIKDILPSVLSQLQNPESQHRRRLSEQWGSIIGEKFAKETQPSLGKQGKLWIWAERSAVAFEINQKYKSSILKRAQALLGEEAVTEVRVCVGEPHAL